MRREPGSDETIDFTALNPVTPADAADYIEKMCAELAALSSQTGLRFLYYLLEVAREEAAAQALDPDNRSVPPYY